MTRSSPLLWLASVLTTLPSAASAQGASRTRRPDILFTLRTTGRGRMRASTAIAPHLLEAADYFVGFTWKSWEPGPSGPR